MKDFVIFTDSGCDLPVDYLKELDVRCLDFTFRFDGEDRDYSNADISNHEFYERMRQGASAKTAALNLDTFRNAFEPELKQGRDVLYVGFSSGLTSTYHVSTLVAEELKEEYPERKILTVDTLAASAGLGMLVWLAADTRKKGGTLEETAAAVENHKMHVAHWFTVGDLEYLKRSGRLSSAAALMGGLLGIKPILHTDNEGHLIKRGTVRGRKAALKELVNKYQELACCPGEAPVYICNADCPEDVVVLKELLDEVCGCNVDLVVDIGPVIGAHCGPGTIAVFFMAKER